MYFFLEMSEEDFQKCKDILGSSTSSLPYITKSNRTFILNYIEQLTAKSTDTAEPRKESDSTESAHDNETLETILGQIPTSSEFQLCFKEERDIPFENASAKMFMLLDEVYNAELTPQACAVEHSSPSGFSICFQNLESSQTHEIQDAFVLRRVIQLGLSLFPKIYVVGGCKDALFNPWDGYWKGVILPQLQNLKNEKTKEELNHLVQNFWTTWIYNLRLPLPDLFEVDDDDGEECVDITWIRLDLKVICFPLQNKLSMFTKQFTHEEKFSYPDQIDVMVKILKERLVKKAD